MISYSASRKLRGRTAHVLHDSAGLPRDGGAVDERTGGTSGTWNDVHSDGAGVLRKIRSPTLQLRSECAEEGEIHDAFKFLVRKFRDGGARRLRNV